MFTSKRSTSLHSFVILFAFASLLLVPFVTAVAQSDPIRTSPTQAPAAPDNFQTNPTDEPDLPIRVNPT